MDVERSIEADGVMACLERLAAERGAPAYVRFDHGPEFIAYVVAHWCQFNATVASSRDGSADRGL